MNELIKKNWIWGIVALIIIAVIFSFVLFNEGNDTPSGEEIAIRINDETLSYEEFNNMMEQVSLEMQMYGVGLNEQELKDQTVEMLIQQILLGELAKQEGIEVTEQEINEYFDELMVMSGFEDKEDFLAQLEMQGFEDLKEIEDLLKIEIIVEKLVDFYKEEIDITEEDLESAYQDYLEIMGEEASSFEEMREQLKDSLIQEEITPLIFDKLDRLRETAEIEIFIDQEDIEIEIPEQPEITPEDFGEPQGEMEITPEELEEMEIIE